MRHVFPDGTVLDSSSDPRCSAPGSQAALGAGGGRRTGRGSGGGPSGSGAPPGVRCCSGRSPPASLARLSWRLGDLAAIAPGRSLRDLGRRYLRDPRLRMLLDRYATYTGADPRRAPGRAGRDPLRRAGLRRLVPARAAWAPWPPPCSTRCAALGVESWLSSPVAAGITRPAAGSAASASGPASSLPADVVVSNVDALTTYRDLLPTPARLAGLTDRSLAGFVLLLGVRGETPSLAHHTVFFPRDYDAEFDAIFGDPGRGVRARPADDPTVFVTRADDPAVHPPGRRGLVRAGQRAAARHRLGGGRLAAARAGRGLRGPHPRPCWPRAGLDVRDRLQFVETRTPADLADVGGGAGRRDLRHRRAVWCGRRTAGRSTGSTWSAGRPIRAAACRWSRCPRRSSPTRSALAHPRPEPPPPRMRLDLPLHASSIPGPGHPTPRPPHARPRPPQAPATPRPVPPGPKRAGANAPAPTPSRPIPWKPASPPP